MTDRSDPVPGPAAAPPGLTRRAALAALGTAAPLALAGCAEPLFFAPNARDFGGPERLNLLHEEAWIEAEGGARLHAWFLPVPPGPDGRPQPVRGTVLHVHGNAANISNHLPLVAWLPAQGWQVLTFDYRGYGRSSGSHSIDGVVDDTVRALDWLRARPDVDPQRVVVLGQSLGGATAIRAVARSPQGVRLLVSEGAFASYRGIADEVGDALGTVFWAFQRLNRPFLPGAAADPVTAVPALPVPLLLIHGTADTVIPFHHGEALHAAARTPKGFIRIDGGRHVDGLRRVEVRRAVLQRMNELAGPPPA
jgi:fermentation-respiration switch protein FrsA (DUF1100 family)